jgi:DNA-binding response OmpR family regulator
LEFELFLYFSQNKWKVLSRQNIYEKVWWEYDEFNMGKTVDVYIWYLRKKLGKELIETRKWFWYIIQ